MAGDLQRYLPWHTSGIDFLEGGDSCSGGAGGGPVQRAVPVVSSLRFLVVDDAASNRKFLIRAIAKQMPRAEFEEADDGGAAVAAVARDVAHFQVCVWDIKKALPLAQLPAPQQMPWPSASLSPSLRQVVLMDKEMRHVDGYAAAERIRELGFRGVVIGVTANALGADVAEFMRHGVNDAVTKPVRVADLLNAVEEHMNDPVVVSGGVEAAPVHASAAGRGSPAAAGGGDDEEEAEVL